MDNFFTFNGKPCTDFGVVATGTGTYNRPRRRVEYIDVPGRNGSLTVSDGTYENVTLWYDCFAFKNFPEKMDAISAWLLSKPGYLRLEDTYHQDYYRLAEFAGPIEPTPTTLMRSGKFRLEFNCKPEKYLKSGEQFIDITWPATGINKKIYNPTMFDAKPLFHLQSPNSKTISIYCDDVLDCIMMTGNITGLGARDIYIDCDAWESYGYSIDGEKVYVNSEIYLNYQRYPVLKPGVNEVRVTKDSATNKDKIEAMFRWWTI